MVQTNAFHRGDRVEWNTSQGRIEGRVVKRLTENCSIEDYDVKASEDDPKYLVESDKTGERAAHKPDALTMIESSDIG